jgi:hypothetical protein
VQETHKDHFVEGNKILYLSNRGSCGLTLPTPQEDGGRRWMIHLLCSVIIFEGFSQGFLSLQQYQPDLSYKHQVDINAQFRLG